MPGVGLISAARRRSSAGGGGDTLADLFANGEIGDWWRFDNAHTDQTVVGSGITQATGLVNGLTLDDADPANVPKLQQASGNYLARFDGTGDRLFHNFGSDIAQPGTIIICLNFSSIQSSVYITGSSSTKRWQISNASSNTTIMFAGSTFDTGLAENFGIKVLTGEFNGASNKFRVNGTQLGSTGNPGTQATNQITVGAVWDGTGTITGDIYSVLFIDRLLTSGAGGELDRAERLLGSHAGLSW